jgi:hypothetical protein
MANLLQFEANAMERMQNQKPTFKSKAEKEADRKKKEEQAKDPKSFGVCCKKVSKFLASHIGLVAMVILYTVAGGFLFALLEQHQEAKDCQEGKGQEAANIVNLKSQLLTYIQYNVTTNPLDTSKDNETVANTNIEQWLQDFRDDILSVRSSYRYSGQDCSQLKWNLAGAMLFAVTIITTIGLYIFIFN